MNKNNNLKLNKILNSEKFLKKVIITVKKEYRPYDPGNYLYNLVVKNNKSIFEDKNLELIYTTLISWNMNSRGARLTPINIFKKSILNNKKIIIDLKKYTFKDLLINFDEIFEKLYFLYNNLELCKQKTKIVTFSKTMHFLLPNLCVPIDRKYALNFFYNNRSITNKNEFRKYKEINLNYCKIYEKYDLSKYLGKISDNGIRWNITIPKILDNVVIGYGILKN
ncbi:MAG: hypothetical protein PHR26_02365 [Candidatus ainarchaeum sp.]|nr:hypothetical protein [Candidatus ainarchaeum sp.]MDD3975900.1 hypothetical protein [Candidatus ainarchaeum sp.]